MVSRIESLRFFKKKNSFLGIRPAVLSIQYNQEYRQAYKSYLKVFFLLKNRTPTDEDKANLRDKEQRLKQIVAKHAEQLKRETVVEISSENAYRTGFKSDIIQHSLLLSSLQDHLRFHHSLTELETHLVGYKFRNRWLMQLALTHPSGNYVLHNNLGPNPDHVKNTLVKERFSHVDRMFTVDSSFRRIVESEIQFTETGNNCFDQ